MGVYPRSNCLQSFFTLELFLPCLCFFFIFIQCNLALSITLVKRTPPPALILNICAFVVCVRHVIFMQCCFQYCNSYCTDHYLYISAFLLASTVRRRVNTSVKLPMLNWAPVAVVNEKSVFKVCHKNISKVYYCAVCLKFLSIILSWWLVCNLYEKSFF